jgi:hypothetical protein
MSRGDGTYDDKRKEKVRLFLHPLNFATGEFAPAAVTGHTMS